MAEARRICFLNFKGGVGKTSLSVNVGAALAHELQKKVLLVDCDPQSNASIWLMGNHRWSRVKNAQSVGGLLTSEGSIYKSIERSVVRDEKNEVLIHNLDLLPAVNDLIDVEREAENPARPHYMRFFETISSQFGAYDYIVFDCPPNMYKLSQCAVFASREIYVPCRPDELSRVGLAWVDKELASFLGESEVHSRHIAGYNAARIRGVVINALDKRTKSDSADEIEARAKNLKLQSDVFDKQAFILPIEHSVQVQHSAYRKRPMAVEKGSPKLQEQYNLLAQLIEARPPKDGKG